MQLEIPGRETRSFEPREFESTVLPALDQKVNISNDRQEIYSAISNSASCLNQESRDFINGRIELFLQNPSVYLYIVEGEDRGYARSVEFDSNIGEVLGMEAVIPGDDSPPSDDYRAYVNAAMKHAEIRGLDAFIGGKEVFAYSPDKAFFLYHEEPNETAAEEVYFGQDPEIREFHELGLDKSHLEHNRGENWGMFDQYFVARQIP